MNALVPYLAQTFQSFPVAQHRGKLGCARWVLRPHMVTFIDILEQGQVPNLLSIGQMQNPHMTIEHTAFGMIRQVSSSGHARVDLAAFCKQHDGTANKAFDDDKINPIAHPSLLAAAYPAEAASKEPVVPAPARRQRRAKRSVMSTTTTGYPIAPPRNSIEFSCLKKVCA